MPNGQEYKAARLTFRATIIAAVIGLFSGISTPVAQYELREPPAIVCSQVDARISDFARNHPIVAQEKLAEHPDGSWFESARERRKCDSPTDAVREGLNASSRKP